MVVDGRTLSRILGTDSEPLLAQLAHGCRGVVVCRASPSQKAAIVLMMKHSAVRAYFLLLTAKNFPCVFGQLE